MIRMNIHDAERVLCLMYGGAMKGDRQGNLSEIEREAVFMAIMAIQKKDKAATRRDGGPPVQAVDLPRLFSVSEPGGVFLPQVWTSIHTPSEEEKADRDL